MRRGLSLIEVLVVVGILAVLAAILFPVFARAKREGLTTTCRSNLRGVATAWNLYVEDSNGAYPDEMIDQLFPYGKSLELFHCPMDRGGMAGLPVSISRGQIITYQIPFAHYSTGPAKGVDAWQFLREADANHGILYCPFHGDWERPYDGSSNMSVSAISHTKGRILVARRDGSVSDRRAPRREVQRTGYSIWDKCQWEVLTDAPMRRGVCVSEDGNVDLFDGKIKPD